MEIGVLTDTGKIREINQDDYLIHENSYCMFMVADGMGGHSCGEIASKMALEAVCKQAGSKLNNNVDVASVTGILNEAFHKANQQIMQYANENPECHGMGTTLSMIWIKDHHGVIAHVGDSRIYLLRNKELFQLTEDHSLVAELFRRGEITEEEALVHPQKHVITRAMGIDETLRADYIPLEFKPDDVLLLCTDGVTNLICDDELRSNLMNIKSASKTAKALIEMANERGGYDNSTAIIVRRLLSEPEGRCSY
ncbi:MAG: Stp1/IreP family PP2C-type Ser/Thr phosphatase [Tindallia sp. MSAO_Bac2]|nr:MAG: Stp1/IreP family PP2C-type Ser/Thr phosphatase [Tindallia sp. MSAO_Bac2]